MSGECPRCAKAKVSKYIRKKGGHMRQHKLLLYSEEESCLSRSCRRVTPNKPSQRHRIDLRPHLGHRGSKREQPCLYMIDVKRGERM